MVAPGVSILSCVPGGLYGQADGTSMAAPQVCGVAALVLAKDYGLSADQVRAVIDASAIDMGLPGRDMQYGYGLINAKRAVDLAGMYAVNRAPSPVGGRTIIARGGVRLPAGAEQASVYDGSGRLVHARNAGAGRLSLAPGTYFVRTSTMHEAQGARSDVTYKVLVLD